MSKKEDKRAEYHTRKDIPGVNDLSRLQTEPCYICGSKENLHRHRVIPNGTYEWWNVVIVCRLHHQEIHRVINERKGITTLEQYQKCIEVIFREHLYKLINVTKCPPGIPRNIDLGY